MSEEKKTPIVVHFHENRNKKRIKRKLQRKARRVNRK